MKSFRRIVVVLAIGLLAGCTQDPRSRRDTYFQSGEKYLRENKYDEATIQFRNALQIDKRHVPSYLGLAKVFQSTGDPVNAMTVYQQVLKIDEKNVEARLQLGRFFLGLGSSSSDSYKQAREMAEQILQSDASNIEARILLGNAYSGEGNVDRSIQELETATKQDPANLQAALSLGAAQLRKNETQKAETTFRQALEKHPNEVAALLTLAAFLDSLKRSAEAETYFKKAFEVAPSDPKSLNSMVDFYVAQKRFSDAESVFKQAIAVQPASGALRVGFADFYVRQGSSETGVNVLLDLLKTSPGNRQVQVRLAEIYVDQGKPAKAEEIARDLLAKNRNDGEAHQLLGRVLRERQEFDQAMAEFEKAIELNDRLIPSFVEKANLLQLRGDLEGAQQTLNAALERDRNNVLVRGMRAKILAVQQRPEDAIQEAQSVLTRMPSNQDAIVALGDAYRTLGRLPAAKAEFLKLVEMRPDYPFYLYRLGNIEAALGETPAALTHLRKAVETDPKLLIAINDILFLHAKDKRYDAALAELDRLSKLGAAQNEIHRFRGQVYLAKGDAAAAERELRAAIQKNPKDYQAYMLLADVNVAQKNLAQAIRDVDQLLAQDNRYVPGFFLKGYYLQLSNDKSGALASYRKALELDPDNALANNNAAWLLAENDATLNEALTFATKAKRGLPADPEVADTLGWIHYKQHSYVLAIDQLRFSVNNRPKPEAENYFRLGLAYFAKGDLALAQQTMKKALQMNPSFAGSDEARRILDIRG